VTPLKTRGGGRGLHLVRLELVRSACDALGERRGLPSGHGDEGYLAHCAMVELFGELAPRPFWIQPREKRGGRRMEVFPVLGYSAAPAGEVEDAVGLFMEPAAFGTLHPGSIESKPVALGRIREGARFGFELTACPVVRTRRGAPGERRHANAGPIELDAHRHATLEALRSGGAPPDRQEAYLAWLKRRLEGDAVSELAGARVLGQRTRAAVRRRGGGARREGVEIEIPDVTFSGTLRVGDPSAFAELVRSGVGRHKAFGFGMLRLRPPGS